ncbi:uncharacterized protein PSFLO_05414 [Pseudozyma flocculosa]|uniref:Protein phosphatase inhibitor 2 n=2 Tax=Pseudozyma flocculosa TaxID=84751 RepID=A0A5C3F5Z0_9BASI|nr:uncharacterized protein PSFLO_05414 [Pseudozyma flocculosa]
MSSPRHSPPRSAAAPRPKGILKNASERTTSQGAAPPLVSPTSVNPDDANNHLQWDETNLTLHELQRAQEEARMKIDEPKTPFVRSASLGPFGDDDMSFDLDAAGPSTPGSRRGSAANQLAANTSANAGRRPSASDPASGSGVAGTGTGLAVGLDAADLARSASGTSQSHAGSENEAGLQRAPSSRSTSRSPSFSLPKTSSRRSSARSATGDIDQRTGLRQENEERNMQVDDDDEDDGAVEEEDPDPETQAKHAAFAAKRNQHYGNEAEAMKIAAALAARDDDEDEDDDDEEDAAQSGPPPVPPLPNGSRQG